MLVSPWLVIPLNAITYGGVIVFESCYKSPRCRPKFDSSDSQISYAVGSLTEQLPAISFWNLLKLSVSHYAITP